MRRIRSQLTYANVVATLALFIALGGGTAAALSGSNTVQSDDLGPGAQVKAPDVADNAVNGADVVNNSLTGADVREPTLQGVNASSVSGLNVRKIRFQAPFGTPPTVVLDLGGLKIRAECQDFGDRLDVKALTTKENASAFIIGTLTHDPNDADGIRDFAGDHFRNGNFDTADVLEVDDQIPGNAYLAGIATLHYEAPDGSVVVVDLALDPDDSPPAGSECTMTGVAIGG